MDRKHRGFTIIELMIVVTIIGVLAAVGLPAMGELMKNNRRTTVVNELVSSLMLARGEAAKQGRRVVTCAFDDANNDKTMTLPGEIKCSGSGAEDWRDGWVTFVDTDADGALDAAELPVLRQFVNDYADITVTLANVSLDGVAVKSLTMKPYNNGSSTGVVRICDKRGSTKARALLIGSNGRAQISEKEDLDPVTPVSCS